MKKLRFFLGMMFLSCVATLCLTSCSDDDNNNPSVPDDKATAVDMQVGLYVPESTMKYFDIVLSDKDGNKTTLSTTNTTVDNTMSFGDLDVLTKSTTIDKVNSANTKMRLFKFDKNTVKSFPASFVYTVSATAKSGVTPASDEKVALGVTWATSIKNNSKDNGWDALGISGSTNTLLVLGSKWDNVKDKESKLGSSLKLSFKNAKSLSGSIE